MAKNETGKTDAGPAWRLALGVKLGLRTPGHSALAFLVAAALVFGLGTLLHTAGANRAEIARLYDTLTVSGGITPATKRNSAYPGQVGYFPYYIEDQLLETGYIDGIRAEADEAGVSFYPLTEVAGALQLDMQNVRRSTVVFASDDLAANAAVQQGDVTLHFADAAQDAAGFAAAAPETGRPVRVADGGSALIDPAFPIYPALVAQSVAASLPGDYVAVQFTAGPWAVYRVVGTFTGRFGDAAEHILALPLPALRAAMEQRDNAPTYELSVLEFTLRKSCNPQMTAVRQALEELVRKDYVVRNTPDISPNLPRGPVQPVVWVQDGELTQAVAPLEQNLALVEILHPVLRFAAVLTAAALCLLLLVQRTKDAAVLRILGLTRGRTCAVLCVEPLLAALVGVLVGTSLVYLFFGGGLLVQALLDGALYMVGGALGTAAGLTALLRKKPLALLQVRE